MTVTVQLPSELTGGKPRELTIPLAGDTVADLMTALAERFSDPKDGLVDAVGSIRDGLRLVIGDRRVASASRDSTPLAHGDHVRLLIARNPGALGGEPADDIRLDPIEIRRYARHLVLPEVAMDGQRRLKSASVLLVGAGGLGSPAGLYLAAAGVGRIGLVDSDVVDYTNLQRQIMHGTKDVGRSKLASAGERLRDINPHIRIELHETALTSDNALSIIPDYDIVIDGTDNFPTRYLVNDACALLGKPNVYGSIYRFEGQASVFWAERGPCYRCLYPKPPPPGLVPDCAEGGVLGVLPGLVGTLQATEAVKLILGRGSTLIGRLLLVDAMEMAFRDMSIRRDEGCPVCGTDPTIDTLIDYEEFCGVPATSRPMVSAEWNITPAELKARLDAGGRARLIDVRTEEEWKICRLEAATFIPLQDLPARAAELDPRDELVLYCRVGIRSAHAVAYLRDAGFERAMNLEGGLVAWAESVDPDFHMY